MRKHIRNLMRVQAEKENYKPSRAIAQLWNNLQIKRYGIKKRCANKARGTLPKHKWKSSYERMFG